MECDGNGAFVRPSSDLFFRISELDLFSFSRQKKKMEGKEPLDPLVAALEGHEKKPIHIHALRNNHTSLICASHMANHPYENVARSPIFKLQNIQTTNNLDGNSFSLSKMRSDIHKLKPEDLEETIIEKPTSHLGTNRSNEIQIRDQRGLSTLTA